MKQVSLLTELQSRRLPSTAATALLKVRNNAAQGHAFARESRLNSITWSTPHAQAGHGVPIDAVLNRRITYEIPEQAEVVAAAPAAQQRAPEEGEPVPPDFPLQNAAPRLAQKAGSQTSGATQASKVKPKKGSKKARAEQARAAKAALAEQQRAPPPLLPTAPSDEAAAADDAEAASTWLLPRLLGLDPALLPLPQVALAWAAQMVVILMILSWRARVEGWWGDPTGAPALGGGAHPPDAAKLAPHDWEGAWEL